jgi:hypothetical protein
MIHYSVFALFSIPLGSKFSFLALQYDSNTQLKAPRDNFSVLQPLEWLSTQASQPANAKKDA